MTETNEGGMLTEMYVDGGHDGASQGFCLQAEGYQLTASITLPHRPPLSEFGTFSIQLLILTFLGHSHSCG